MPSKSKSKKKKSSGKKKGGGGSSGRSPNSAAIAPSLSSSPATTTQPPPNPDPEASPLDNDPRFLREYSKSLADALRANERLPPPPPSKLVTATYRALCHDDPIVDGAAGGDGSCRLLAERICCDAFGEGAFVEEKQTAAGGYGGGAAAIANDGLDAVTSGVSGMTMKRRGGGNKGGASATPAAPRPQSRLVVPTMSSARGGQGSGSDGSKFALSDRLVGGILQATDRTSVPLNPNNNSTSKDGAAGASINDDDGEEEMPASFVSGPGGQSLAVPATPAGYSELAYAALVRGPLLCCRPPATTDLTKIASFLGSYGGHGRDRVDTKEEDNDKDVASKWEDEMLEKAAEAYVQSMRDMGKSMSGGGDGVVVPIIPSPPAGEDEKKEKDDGDDKAGEEEWDSIGDSSSSSSSFQQQQQQLANRNIAETNSLEEVFAEESDPDDFEYESNHDPAAELATAVQYIEESFDPNHLSKADSSLSWDGARDRLTLLLDDLAYNRLVFLNQSRWDKLGVSTTLVELTRILLDADVVNESGGSRAAVVRTETLLRRPTHMKPSPSLRALTAQWSKPLSVLRDRALDATYDHDSIDVYTGLIKSLLNSPVGGPGGAKTTGKPSATQIVGLSSLSSLCGFDGILRTKSASARRKVRASVVDSIDGIIDLVELVRQAASSSVSVAKSKRDLPSAFITDEDEEKDPATQDKKDNSTSEWVRVAICLLPVIQFLTNTQFSDYGRLDWSDSSATLSTQEAQALLSTGLFRELILLQAGTGDQAGAVAVTRTRLLRAVFLLSAQSVTVLGKYATRVPELSSQIHSDAFAEKNLVDSTLWAALSAFLQSSNKSTLKLRGAAAPPSIDKLNGNCLRGFVTLCDRVAKALGVMASNDPKQEDGEEKNAEAQSIEEAPYDFVKFTNCIANLPSIAKSWVNAITSVDGGAEKAQHGLETIRNGLSRIPIKKITSPPPPPGKDHEVGEIVDDGKAEDSTQEDKKKNGRVNEEVVSSVRKGVKIVSLLLESGPSGQSETDKLTAFALSSKTD